MKINFSYYFHTSLWYLRRFYEGLHGLQKLFEVPWINVEIKKLNHIFSFSAAPWREGLRLLHFTQFFLIRIFLYLDWMQEHKDQIWQKVHYGKTRTRKNSVFGHFSCSVTFWLWMYYLLVYSITVSFSKPCQ